MTALQQVSSPLILIPAYGRTYASPKRMIEDWNEGKDFRIMGHGCYTSIRDYSELTANSSSVTLTDPRGNFSITL